MSTDSLMERLEDLRTRQKKIDDTWKNTGNKPLLEFFIELIPRVLDCERCSIFILDPEANNIWLQCGTGLEEREVSVHLNDSMVGRVISTASPLFEHNMNQRAGVHEWVDIQTGFVTHNALCVPVKGSSENTVTGAIQALNKQPGAEFSNDDCEIMEKVAAHMQMNIENIFLRQQLAKLLEDVGVAIKKIEGCLDK